MREFLVQSLIALGDHGRGLGRGSAGWPLAAPCATLRTITATHATSRRTTCTNASTSKALTTSSRSWPTRSTTCSIASTRPSAQQRFVANASHELRTPLARQRTLIKLRWPIPTPRSTRSPATCHRVLAAGDEQARLIDTLLALAHGQAGVDRREDFDLATVADKVVLRCEAEARTRPSPCDRHWLQRRHPAIGAWSTASWKPRRQCRPAQHQRRQRRGRLIEVTTAAHGGRAVSPSPTAARPSRPTTSTSCSFRSAASARSGRQPRRSRTRALDRQGHCRRPQRHRHSHAQRRGGLRIEVGFEERHRAASRPLSHPPPRVVAREQVGTASAPSGHTTLGAAVKLPTRQPRRRDASGGDAVPARRRALSPAAHAHSARARLVKGCPRATNSTNGTIRPSRPVTRTVALPTLNQTISP